MDGSVQSLIPIRQNTGGFMEPLISVIVPVYNGQDYLEKCIDSVERQTYPDLEVIIVNDGSIDDTWKVCESLRERYDNVTVITLGDEGVSTARNKGLEASTGEYVTFVDADDRILPDMLRCLYDLLKETDSDLAGCGFFGWQKEEEWQVNAGGRIVPEEEAQVHIYGSEDYLSKAILKGNSRCWSKLYKRKVIDSLRFHRELTIGEDMLFLVELLPRITRVAETTRPLYGYFQNPKGAMQRAFTPEYMDQITCWELARQQVMRMNGRLKSEVTAILLMAIMLTTGKLALLPGNERAEQKEYIRLCHDKIKDELRDTDAYEKLDRGYRMKTKLFAKAPKLFLWLYHFRKYGR